MKDRILRILKEKDLSANKFAEMINIQPSGLSHIVNGRNKPGYEFIVKTLERFSDINPDWLILGKGDIYRPRSNDNDHTLSNDNKNSLFQELSTAGKAECTEDGIIDFKTEKELVNTTSFDSSATIASVESKPVTQTVPIAKKIVLLNNDGTADIYEIR